MSSRLMYQLICVSTSACCARLQRVMLDEDSAMTGLQLTVLLNGGSAPQMPGMVTGCVRRSRGF
jgi:hypothetical protein